MPKGTNSSEATGRADEVTIEQANGSVNDVKCRNNNESASIKSTCETETENVIIDHERNSSRSTSAAESVINNELSAEKEANLAIGMLDTVLEAEDEDEDDGEYFNSRSDSGTSIKNKDVDVPKREVYNEKLLENSQTLKLEIIDPASIRSQIEVEIDDILERARASVADIQTSKLNEIQSDDDENIFKNQKFLTHLSDLISKSNQKTQSSEHVKTLGRNSVRINSGNLKHSKSAPDLKLLMEFAEIRLSTFNDDTGDDYLGDETVSDNGVGEDYKPNDAEISIPTPPVFSAELLEKVATLRRKHEIEDSDDDEKVIAKVEEEEDSKSLEDESVNREDFRDKLEKLLQAPPTRLSLLAPTPLPRVSLAKNDNREVQPSVKDPNPTPVSATMLKQRALFDEVLKKLQNKEDEVSLN